MDRMPWQDIILVGIPEALVWLFFGLFLNSNDYLKSKKKTEVVFKSVLSVVLALGTIVFIRGIVSDIVQVCITTGLVWTIVFKFIWRINFRVSLISGLLAAFLSPSVENLFTQLFIHMSKFSNIFTQSRFVLSIPIRVTEIIIVFLVFISNASIGKLEIFNKEWRLLSLSRKITFFMLIIFVSTGIIIAGAYTDILIKTTVFKIDVSKIIFDIQAMFYGVILLMFSGLFLFSRTRGSEKLKDIEQAFDIPREKLFTNFLRASDPEDRVKYKAILDDLIEGREIQYEEK